MRSDRDMTLAARHALGGKPAAYAIRIGSTTVMDRWIQGTDAPTGLERQRLLALMDVLLTLQAHEGWETVRAWFFGANPQLDDEAPLEWCHRGEHGRVLRAARSFVDGGIG